MKAILLAFVLVASVLIAMPARPASAVVAGDLTLLPAAGTPVSADSGSSTAVTVGASFTVRQPGTITGVRFYKSAANTGTHIGYLFDYGFSNTPLKTVTFSGETAGGWQEATFSSPQPVAANEQFVIAYYAPNGHTASDTGYFSTPKSAWPFDLAADAGGISALAPPHQPDQLHDATNYWVDAIFKPTPFPSCPCNVLGSATPGTIDGGDGSSNELGMIFKTYEAGYITGVRFYKAAANTGTHVGKLWSDDGALLASVTFTGETATGWQQASFSSPVAVQQGTFYRVSYLAPNGHYSYDPSYFMANNDVLPLSTIQNSSVYRAGSGFPDNSAGNGANYWVDPVFTTAGATVMMSVDVEPSFLFSVGNQGAACNGESNFVSGAGSASAVSLGHLAVSSNLSGAQALTVSSNAGGGFAVYIAGTQPSENLRSGGHNWVDVDGTHAGPLPLGSGERFGYTYADATAASSVSNPASATFAKLDNVNRAVMGSTTTSAGTGCVAFDVQSSATSPAGAYTATVKYTAVPTF